MNQRSVVITLAVVLSLFSVGMILAVAQQAQDAFGRLAFGALTALAAFIQQQPKQ